MPILRNACAVILAATMPAAAFADDPKDPDMSTAAARARDAEIIRQLNTEQARYVQERDARYAEGWRAYREAPRRQAEYEAQMRASEDSMARHDRERDSYEREMAEWRRDVAACRAGDYSACRN
jgi:flagellar biosynthesis/type III secretory pathway protein FliH